MRSVAARRIAACAAAAIAIAGCASHASAPPRHALPGNCTTQTQPFTGTVCVPPVAHGKHAAMLLLGGSEGGDSMGDLAALFAAHGYVASTVAYFRAPGLPKTLVDVPVETVGTALDSLAHRSDVDASRIGILGISKGGELALLAASTYPQIKAVVAVVPSPVAYMGLGAGNEPVGCSWSKGGVTLPCVAPDDGAGQRIATEFMTHQPVVLRDLYDASRNANPAQTQASFFPLERIAGPVLCLAGRDDAMWNSSVHCALASAYLQARHHPYADRSIAYASAGHTFLGAMHGPNSAVTSYDAAGATIEFGGTKAGDASAARAAWPVIWAFLAKRLGS